MLAVMASSYVALQDTAFAYADVVFGLTLTVVIASSLLAGQLYSVAVYRSLEVIVGILCIALVNLLLRYFFPKKEAPHENLREQLKCGWKELTRRKKNKSLFPIALRITIATALLFLPWLYFRYPGGFWGVISCFFIMEEDIKNVHQKGWWRFLSHVIAAAIGVVIALSIGTHLWLLLIPIVVIYFVLGYLMVVGKALSTSCNTLGIALAVMLLVDPGMHSTLDVITARFINVIAGIGVGIIISHYFSKGVSALKN